MKLKNGILGVALACAAVSAQCAPSTGKWIGATDEAQVATGVASDTGALFGMNCNRRSRACKWALSIETPCESGESTPLLASAGNVALHLVGTCIGQSQEKALWRYELTGVEEHIQAAVLAGGVLGIAVAHSDGRFIVYRFDIDGANAAFAALKVAWDRLLKSTGRDQEL